MTSTADEGLGLKERHLRSHVLDFATGANQRDLDPRCGAAGRQFIESFSIVDVKTMRRQCKCNARSAHGRKQRVDCKGHQRPPKMFSKSRFVPAG
jgi:hypothetical protein